MTIAPATRQDLPAVRALLQGHGLPVDGVDDLAETMIVARDDSRLIGVAALELYAGGALLRSVAVDGAAQGRRVGHRLTEAALQMAQAHGAPAVFLLTTTAEHFFPKFGFERIARGEVPSSVQESVEFKYSCPASAVVLRKRLPASEP